MPSIVLASWVSARDKGYRRDWKKRPANTVLDILASLASDSSNSRLGSFEHPPRVIFPYLSRVIRLAAINQ